MYKLTENGLEKTQEYKPQIGQILHQNGYNYSDFVTVELKEDYCIAVNLETFEEYRFEYYILEPIANKKDDRIQVYITDKVLSLNEAFEYYARTKDKKRIEEARKQELQETRKANIERGEAIYKQKIPAEAKALIVAERDINDSDIQTDYFSHRTVEVVVLGWSKTTRNSFAEMRKYADRIPETAHLKYKNKYHIEIHPVKDFKANGIYYYKGGVSHWHEEVKKVFYSREEAEKYVAKLPKPLSVDVGDGEVVDFEYIIKEESMEHREDWSMGSGYYLKDGSDNSTGWRIKKTAYIDDDIYLSLVKRCVI